MHQGQRQSQDQRIRASKMRWRPRRVPKANCGSRKFWR